MDSASILVLVLIAGVVGLLMWFELNSRNNDARKKAPSGARAHPDMPTDEKASSDSDRHKAA